MSNFVDGAEPALPFDILREIALKDPDVFLSMYLAIPALFRYYNSEPKRFGQIIRREVTMVREIREPAIKYKRYTLGGLLHNFLDQPARTTSAEGNKLTERWYWCGKLHREGGPSVIKYDYDGVIAELWYRMGQLHRADGPAWFRCHRNNVTEFRYEEKWYKHGKLHREDGPAIIWRDEDGEISGIGWYIDGERIKDDK